MFCDRCKKEISEKRFVSPPMQLDKSVKEYFDLFTIYALGNCLNINADNVKLLFMRGLSPDNVAETKCFDITNLPPIDNIVNYLSMVEQFRHEITG